MTGQRISKTETKSSKIEWMKNWNNTDDRSYWRAEIKYFKKYEERGKMIVPCFQYECMLDEEASVMAWKEVGAKSFSCKHRGSKLWHHMDGGIPYSNKL
jgi:hypothetical protein